MMNADEVSPADTSNTSSQSDARLTIALTTPLPEDLCLELEQLEPRVRLLRDHGLLPPMRTPADHNGDPGFRRSPAQERAFDAMIDEADAIYGVPGSDPAELARIVRKFPRVRWVQGMAAGTTALVAAANLARAELDRVTVTSSAGAHGSELAEFALLGALAGAKSLPKLLADQQAHRWSESFAMGHVHGQSVLVVGLGNIGRACAALFHKVGSRVVAVNRSPTTDPAVSRVGGLGDIVEFAEGIDVLVVTLPGTASTDGLVDSAVLNALRPGATVINVGRGTVIDEPALETALISHQVGFAALDVVAQEPLDPQSTLWDLPNVLISPHTAALSFNQDRRIMEITADNARRLLDGEAMRNVVEIDDVR